MMLIPDTTSEHDFNSLRRRCQNIIESQRCPSVQIKYAPFVPFTYVGAHLRGFTFGTLGCFVHAGDRLYALTATHVVNNSKNQIRIGNTDIDVEEVIHSKSTFGISALMIPKEISVLWDTKLKDEKGHVLPSRLFNGDIDSIDGMDVYIWGAMSKPGRGRLLRWIMGIKEHIVIEDKFHDSPFASPGDSGAIVCATVAEEIIAISMLMGQISLCGLQEKQRHRYLTALLKPGMEELTRSGGKLFVLCTSG